MATGSNNKIYLFAGAILLGVGGYFGYNYLKKKKADAKAKAEADALALANAQNSGSGSGSGSGSQIPLISKSVEIHTPLPEVKAKLETPTAFLPEDTRGITSKKKQPKLTYMGYSGSEDILYKALFQASISTKKN